MSSSSPNLSPWLFDVHTELFRGRHVVLSGNLSDQVLFDGRWCEARSALRALLKTLGYRHVAVHDSVDGFSFASIEDQHAWDQLHSRACRARSGGTDNLGNGATSVAPDDPPERSLDRADGLASARRALETTAQFGARETSAALPRPALEAARVLLSQADEPVAILFDHADLLFEATSPEDRRLLITLLTHTAREAAFVGSGPTRKRNALLLLERAPEPTLDRLIKAEDQIVRVAVTAKSLAERRAYLEGAAAGFYGAEDLDTEERTEKLTMLARLTEEESIWGLEAARRTSHIKKASIANPHGLFLAHSAASTEPFSQLEPQVIASARDQLARTVVGQGYAIDRVCASLRKSLYGVGFDRESATRERQPRAKFFFVGATGVGKTELARALALLLYGDESALCAFDMATFKGPQSVARLIGSEPGYVGYEQGGALVNAVRRRPNACLLFDEIEKADPTVLDLFLSILDEGRLTDGRGDTASFRDTIVIFTSNAGADTVHERQRSGAVPSEIEVRTHFESAVRDRLSLPTDQGGIGRPELYGRLKGSVIAFDVIRPGTIHGIVEKLSGQWLENVQRRHGLDVALDLDSVVAAVVRALAGGQLASGARDVKAELDRLIDEPLAAFVAEHGTGNGAISLALGEDGQARIGAVTS